MLIAQISDFHLRRRKLTYGVVDATSCLEAAVAALAKLDPAPDLVVATGDLTESGRPHQYELLREILAPLRMPVYVIPGNHDEREALRQAFGSDGYLPARGFCHYTVDQHAVRLVALDTIVPGEAGGRLCDERLQWLERQLAAAPDRPTLIIMHHPPFRTGIEHMDAMGLADADRLAALLTRHPQVERVLCGHLHRSIQARVGAHALASTAPSTAHQIALDLRPRGTGAYVMEPPGYQLHLWRADAGFVSHTGVIGNFAGPHAFPASDAPMHL
jgi:3',5'-cyclic-AMP phosphodiesterase